MRSARAIRRAILEAIRLRQLAAGDLVKAGHRGATNRRILFSQTIDGVERRFHATKGWREVRVAV